MAATQPIINAEAHEVACAVGVVVLCGTLAMFIYPALHAAVPALAASARLTGIYTGATNPNPRPSPSPNPSPKPNPDPSPNPSPNPGATVHELAGVVAAGNAMGPEVARTAVVTKPLRV